MVARRAWRYFKWILCYTTPFHNLVFDFELHIAIWHPAKPVKELLVIESGLGLSCKYLDFHFDRPIAFWLYLCIQKSFLPIKIDVSTNCLVAIRLFVSTQHLVWWNALLRFVNLKEIRPTIRIHQSHFRRSDGIQKAFPKKSIQIIVLNRDLRWGAIVYLTKIENFHKTLAYSDMLSQGPGLITIRRLWSGIYICHASSKSLSRIKTEVRCRRDLLLNNL